MGYIHWVTFLNMHFAEDRELFQRTARTCFCYKGRKEKMEMGFFSIDLYIALITLSFSFPMRPIAATVDGGTL